MASTSTPPIPSSSTSAVWDVFLSFRGPDTRTGFTSYLYDALNARGIWTYKDAPELHSGEIIAPALMNAIWNSKIHIFVLSQNFASSSWCLDELAEILKCFGELGSSVIPVFYKIAPSVVRHQTGSFETALEKHENKYFVGMDKLNKWRLTLSQVADFSGHHVDGTRSEADIVNEVVDAVLREINPVTLNVAKYPTGIDSRVADIKSLLTGGTQGVQYIGIWGMGGIGKTTLAKAVYNNLSRNFEASCFLANVSEVCGRQRGLESLQEQLISNVLKKENIAIHDFEHGMVLIRQRIRKKVVVVVDDLNDQMQLDFLAVGSFGCGSVIILTTRHQDLLVRVGVEATYQYELNELDEADSQHLFNKHAFGDENPSDKYLVLSKEILHHAQGLPLALEFFGSNLCKQPEEEWRRVIGGLKKAMNPNIQKKLVISFESLVDPTLKEMFLDIACFFVGCHRNSAVHILSSCYEHVDACINHLKKRCMIKIDDNDDFSELRMHDLVRDMGWEIARNRAGKDVLRKHSRVYGWKDMYNVLDDDDDKKVNRAIECMVQDNSIDSSPVIHLFNSERFKRLPKLRFLKMRNVNLTGSFEHTFKHLTWLHWFGCPLESLPSDFYPKKLVILEMPCSKITRWNLTKDLNDLKSLDLSFGFELITVPDFSKLPLLESINLRGCSKLQEVDTRIGDLKNLVSLDLSDCPSLLGLPDSVCKLTALKSLKLGSCSALPEELGNMTSLTRLVVDTPNILKLPDSIRRLTKLVELRLHVLKLKIPTVSISCFESLEILDIRCAELLPHGVFGEMFPPNLKQVTLTGVRSMRMRRLPNLSNLKQLERLELRHCSSLREIEGLEELISIKHLDLGGCKSVTKLSNLSNLKQLEILYLTNCSSLKEIKGLEKLISIKKLYLEGCNSIMVRKILTKSFFQISSEFGNAIEIHVDKGQELMQMSHVGGGCTEVRTNLCQEFTGWLLSFTCPRGLDPKDIPEFYYQRFSSPAKSFHTYIYGINGISDHFSCSKGTLMVIVPRKDLIRSREGYDDEDVVFEVTASCRCAGDVKIGVYQLYRPSHDTTLTKRQNE